MKIRALKEPMLPKQKQKTIRDALVFLKQPKQK